MKDYSAAIEDYSMAIELNPEFFEPYLKRGMVYIKNGDTEKAFLDWEKAMSLGYSNADALILKYTAKEKKKQKYTPSEFRNTLEMYFLNKVSKNKRST